MKNLPNRLELAKKLSQDFVYERIKRIKETGNLEGPLVIEFDPTTLCDLACPGCISGDLLNTKFDRVKIHFQLPLGFKNEVL